MSKSRKARHGEPSQDQSAPEPGQPPEQAGRIGTRPLGPAEAESEPQAAESPAPPAEESLPTLESLQAELSQARALVDEYLDGWQRSRAEFANFKKRVERDLEQARTLAAAELLARYLPIVDDIERALSERPAGDGLQAWTDGIELIHRKLIGLLEAEGVERIQAEGQPFDPTLHEAITFEESDGFEHGQVIGVTRQGYRLGERVLRPAMVRVAR